jgi:protease-4
MHLWLALPAFAQDAPVERPLLPFRSVAGEDGAHTLFTNPALLGFDTDPVYAAFLDTTDLTGGGVDALTLATTGSGLGAGIGYRELPGFGSWWTLTSGLSLPLTSTLAVGSAFNWQLPEGGDNNFVSWDLGLGWRPAPWLGLGGSINNLGSPLPEMGVNTRYDAGLALRPLGDRLTLGLDVLADAPPDLPASYLGEASLRLHPMRGVWVRGWADRPLAGAGEIGFGGALELRLADTAVGVDARGSTSSTSQGGGLYFTSVRGDDQLFLPGRPIAELTIGGGYPYQPVASLFSAPEESYLTLLRRLDAAARDPRLKGILLRLEDAQFSVAQIEELRGLIRKARTHGKPVVAWLGGDASNGAYLLASACDKVYLHPAGGLELVGLSAEVQYWKGALDLVGVEAQYAQRAEYKSGPEPMTRTGSSDPAREELDALIDDLYGALVTGVAEGRGRSPEEIRATVDAGPYSAREALAKGLVDGLLYPDELDVELEGAFPADYTLADDYARDVDESGWKPQRAVAVVVVDGAISEGESSGGGLFGGTATGSETVARALREAAETRAVKAVVLRVDSPGGSAFASDEIWRAVERVKEAGKPVVVSMGGYAASGGYYVSAGADSIWAEPSTITGSIGVYGGKFNAAGLFDKLGVNTEITARGRNASMFSMSRPMDAVEYAALDRLIGETYAQFKERVAAGRNLTPEKVEEVARGRVWSGSRAREMGLVDSWGGFYEAVDDARVRAGMAPRAPYELVVFDAFSGPLSVPGQVARVRGMIARALTPRIETPPELDAFWRLAALRDEHVFALLPYDLHVE